MTRLQKAVANRDVEYAIQLLHSDKDTREETLAEIDAVLNPPTITLYVAYSGIRIAAVGLRQSTIEKYAAERKGLRTKAVQTYDVPGIADFANPIKSIQCISLWDNAELVGIPLTYPNKKDDYSMRTFFTFAKVLGNLTKSKGLADVGDHYVMTYQSTSVRVVL
jgi:hypothetical protein